MYEVVIDILFIIFIYFLLSQVLAVASGIFAVACYMLQLCLVISVALGYGGVLAS